METRNGSAHICECVGVCINSVLSSVVVSLCTGRQRIKTLLHVLKSDPYYAGTYRKWKTPAAESKGHFILCTSLAAYHVCINILSID